MRTRAVAWPWGILRFPEIISGEGPVSTRRTYRNPIANRPRLADSGNPDNSPGLRERARERERDRQTDRERERERERERQTDRERERER